MRLAQLIAVSAFAGSIGLANAADPIPVEKYAEIPLASVIRMSPDGTKFALTGSRAGKPLLLIRNIEKNIVVTEDLQQFQLRWASWKSPTRLVVSLYASTDDLFFGETVRSQVTRLYALNADGSNFINIGEPKNGFPLDLNNEGSTDRNTRVSPQIQDDLASLLENDPHHVMQTVITSVPMIHQPLRANPWLVDVDTGSRERVGRSPIPFSWYGVDAAGTVRIAVRRDEGNTLTYVRDDASADWRLINQHGAQDPDFVPVAFDPDHPTLLLVLTSDSSGRGGLWAFDTKKLALDHVVDAEAGQEMRVVNGVLLGYERRSGEWVYLDPAWQADLNKLKAALPDHQIMIVDRATDGRHVLAKGTAPHGPPTWWLLDRTVKPTHVTPFVSTYPDIDDAGIAPVKHVTYRARDGLEIAAWLTLPKGVSGTPVPFVVLPHGGPHACDSGDFDYLVQFLASRGYGVLQPQFRGSTCQGAGFEQLGFGQWGFAMQDDVTDGTRWLIDQKLADPKRIAIVGESYGGYAALEGVTKEPDLYRCAAAWAPVSDISLLAHDIRSHVAEPQAALQQLGTDEDRLKAASPALHADRIKVPVLLMHGKTDFTVHVNQSERMEDALKDAHKPVEAIYLDNSDHYLGTQAARLAWLSALNRFLAANLTQVPPKP